MDVSIGKLRAVLLGSGILLLLAITGFVLYAHLRAGFFLRGIPVRLGVDIKQETNGFTYSQSSAGKTIFTIHAAKAIQHNNGKITLHDVGIVLYSREPAGGSGSGNNRADRIYGDDFEYDGGTGEATSAGDVRIDLQAPAAAFKGKREGGIHEDLAPSAQPDPRIIHVRTHGLVFQQKLGLASSSGQVDFTSGGISGHAIGAQYNSQTGVVVLQSAVSVSGLLGRDDKERPAVLTAAHAEFDRTGNQAVFTQAKYISPGQGLAADHAIVHTTREGAPQALEAQGHVVLTGNGQGAVTSGRMDAVFNAAGKPESSHLYDGVQFSDQTGGRGTAGTAPDAQVAFDAEGRASHVLLTGGVYGEQHGPSSTRTLSAATLDLSLAASGPGRSVLRDAKASGNAKLRQVSAPSATKKRGFTTSDLTGDTLLAHFDIADGQPQLSTVDGRGHTLLHQDVGDGAEETSQGDTLSATFHPSSPAHSPTFQPGVSQAIKPGGSIGLQSYVKSASPNKGFSPGPFSRPSKTNPPESQVELQSAVQRGNVSSFRRVPAKPNAAPEIQHSSADEVSYNADADRIVLRGKAQLSDAASALYAERVTLEHTSGDAHAEGNVRVTYIQASTPNASSTEPAHVFADHATMQHDGGTAFFYGIPGKPARMWQGTSRVDAPVLEFVQDDKRLIARGDNAVNGMAMAHALLVSVPASNPGDKPSGPSEKPSGKPPSIVRVTATEIVFTDETRQVELRGKVSVDDPDGVVTANQVTVYLAAAHAPDGAGIASASQLAPSGTQKGIQSNGLMGGQIDHIIATGTVRVVQPDRHADGERLVYTANDKTFVMTGTKASPPRLFDQTRGTVVGTSIRFQSGDDSVLVSGGDGSNGSQRVRTDTRIKQ